jgi:hypothetical protein
MRVMRLQFSYSATLPMIRVRKSPLSITST